MATVRRLPVTLLELLVVIAVLALTSGIAMIGISKSLRDQRFRTEVSMVADELRLAQDLMLVLGTDVHVKFAVHASGVGIDYWLELETGLPKSIKHELVQKHHHLQTVRGVFFMDELVEVFTQGQLDVKFLSKGIVMSKGIMRLSTSDQDPSPPDALNAYIPIAGYPSPIFSVDDFERAKGIYDAYSNESADQALTEDTFLRLADNLKGSYKEETETPTVTPANPQGGQLPSAQPGKPA